MDSVGADDVEVGRDAEPVVGPVVVAGAVLVAGAIQVAGAILVAEAVVVAGVVVGGAVVGGTLGLGVGVMLTSDVVEGPMGVVSLPLPLPLADIELLSDWPGEERRAWSPGPR